jgi:predicted MFS family arabinose efflux permease
VRPRYALSLLLAVFACNFMDRQILGILLPAIKREFAISDTGLGMLVGPAFAVFYTTLGIPLAVLADRGSRRQLIVGSLALFSAMTAVSGLVTSFSQLLLARIGVGVGEAGTAPASHSLIADLYEPHERHTAMAIFALGPQVGTLLAFAFGGWLSQHWGWRLALLVAGAAGLLLALLTQATFPEVPRRVSDLARAASAGPASGGALVAVREMWAHPALRHLLVGASLASAVAYSVLAWTPSFLVRSHGFGAATAGGLLALLLGGVGAIGTFIGGWLADRLSRHDPRWPLWIVALGLALAAPLWSATYLARTSVGALAWMTGPALLVGIFLGPTFALVQTLVDPRRRAVSAALLLFAANLVGYGLGPLGVGVLSDALAPRLGAESLRYALSGLSVVGIWAALHYARAGYALTAERNTVVVVGA